MILLSINEDPNRDHNTKLITAQFLPNKAKLISYRVRRENFKDLWLDIIWNYNNETLRSSLSSKIKGFLWP